VSERAAQPTLTTARLVLRPLAPDDAAAIERHASRFEIAGTTVNIPHPYPPGGAVAFIAAQHDAWRDDRDGAPAHSSAQERIEQEAQQRQQYD
jgi:hypothetical protein